MSRRTTCVSAGTRWGVRIVPGLCLGVGRGSTISVMVVNMDTGALVIIVRAARSVVCPAVVNDTNARANQRSPVLALLVAAGCIAMRAARVRRLGLFPGRDGSAIDGILGFAISARSSSSARSGTTANNRHCC